MADSAGSSFPTTNWSEIGRLDSPEFARVLEALCRRYWYPVYVFVRKRCGDLHQAEDLTQSFFAQVLTKQTFRAADPTKGRFRAFLLTSVRNFITNEFASANTQRRGGRERFVPIDFAAADQRYQRNRVSGARAEDEFDRAWAATLMEHAIERLRREHHAGGHSRRFDLLSPTLRSEPLDFDAIAEELDMDSAAVRKAASRFRQRYGQILREEVAATLSESGNLEEEITWMMELFSR